MKKFDLTLGGALFAIACMLFGVPAHADQQTNDALYGGVGFQESNLSGSGITTGVAEGQSYSYAGTEGSGSDYTVPYGLSGYVKAQAGVGGSGLDLRTNFSADAGVLEVFGAHVVGEADELDPHRTFIAGGGGPQVGPIGLWAGAESDADTADAQLAFGGSLLLIGGHDDSHGHQLRSLDLNVSVATPLASRGDAGLPCDEVRVGMDGELSACGVPFGVSISNRTVKNDGTTQGPATQNETDVAVTYRWWSGGDEHDSSAANESAEAAY